MTLLELLFYFTCFVLMIAIIGPLFIPRSSSERREMGVRLPGDND